MTCAHYYFAKLIICQALKIYNLPNLTPPKLPAITLGYTNKYYLDKNCYDAFSVNFGPSRMKS